jgi:hypothetical protein
MSKIRSQISYYDLTGGLNNVNTMDTLNSSPKKTESPDMVNVEFLKLGGIKSMEGNMLVGDKQPSKIVGGWEYTKGNNKYMIIALQTGEVKRLDPVTETFIELYKFQHQSNRVSFCNMNNGFVATNGIDDPMFYEYGRHKQLTGTVAITANSNEVNGTLTQFTTQLHPGDTVEFGSDDKVYTVQSITSDTQLILTADATETGIDLGIYLSEISPCNATFVNTDPELQDESQIPIRGNAIQFYAGRLWIGGENGLFYSGVGEYNGWDAYLNGAGFIGEVYNDTSEIKALGLYSDYMLVHKEYNTYLLTMSGNDTETLSIKPYSNVSCDSQQSWVVSNTKYYVYSRENMDIFPLSQRTMFSDRYLGEAITNKVRNVFSDLRDSDLNNIFCATLPRKRWMMFYMPMIDRVGSSYALIYDFQSKAFVVRKVPQEVTIAFNFINEVYIGTANGLVLREFLGETFVVDAEYDEEQEKYIPSSEEPINAHYKSPWFDWAGDYYQSFAEFAIDLASEYRNNFYIRTFKDGDSLYEDRVIDDGALTTGGLMWDGDVHDDNNLTQWDKDVWASGNFNSIRMLLPNNVFETFQVEIGTNRLGQSFAIYGYNFRRLETEEAPW